MKTYPAKRLIDISGDLIEIHSASEDSGVDWSVCQRNMEKGLRSILEHCEFLSLDMTRQYAERCLAEVPTSKRGQDWGKRLDELSSRFADETESTAFFFMTPEKRAYFEGRTPFTAKSDPELIERQLPTIHREGLQAGKCFAIGQHTACVFHLLRSMEVAIKLVTVELGVTEPTSDSERSWGRRLPTIKAKLDQNHKANPNWPDKQFFELAHAFFEAVRNPLRNRTMHVDSEYDEESAQDIFNATGALMRHLATKLKE
jgi:hypothetical protein